MVILVQETPEVLSVVLAFPKLKVELVVVTVPDVYVSVPVAYKTVPLTVIFPAIVRLVFNVPTAPVHVPPVMVITVDPLSETVVVIPPPTLSVELFNDADVVPFACKSPLTTHAPESVKVCDVPWSCKPPVNVLPPLVSVAVVVQIKSEVPAMVIPLANVTVPAAVRVALKVRVLV